MEKELTVYEPVLNKWQPIETAPKDGTPVLMWDAWEEKGRGVACWWQGAWVWAEAAVCNEYPGNGPVDPTHWMRLPAPPAQG